MGISHLRPLLWLLLLLPLAAAALPPDTDGDGVHDYADNCLDVGNRDQRNTDRVSEALAPAADVLGNACDCDFDNDGACGISDFNLFLPDFAASTDSGLGTDMDGQPGVGIGDFSEFLVGFRNSAPGAGALPAAVVDGSCDPAFDPTCTDPFTPGACFDARVGADELGAERPWRVRSGADGCPIDAQVLIDVGFDAAGTDPNNPTDAWVRDQTGGRASCPNAAFATFAGGRICDASLPCDPRDHGRRCGSQNNRGGIVSCGDANAPLACEQLSICNAQCGYREIDCANQFHQNLLATCDALTGRERVECRPACIGFADLYAMELFVADPGPGVWSTTDLADEAALCRCGTEPILGEPPSVCGDGVCETLSESCQSTSCPADCGSCALGQACLIDADCGVGSCSREGRCELGWGGASCAADTDCTSGVCLGGQCTSQCGDGVCDGQETCGTATPGACDLDCGVCPFGGACTDPGDCGSGACDTNACAGLPVNGSCTTGLECESGLCNQGRCLAGPSAAGTPCGSHLDCQGDPANPGVAGICDAGFCSPTPKLAGSACVDNTACETAIRPTNQVSPPIGVCNLGVCLGQSVPWGGACDRDEACEWVCDGLVCTGICNEGICLDAQLPFGASCDSAVACESGLFCADGTCKKGGIVDCSSDSECASGICEDITGKCLANCGDGFCDVAGGEICGPDDFLTCQADCGTCSLTEVVITDTIGFCLSNESCNSGICNLGFCIAGPLAKGSKCSTNAACFNGICNWGTCIDELRLVGESCSSDDACETGACSLGVCFDARSVPDGQLCTSSEACEGGVCNFGICTTPRSDGSLCSQNSACQSGACNFGFCVAAASLQTGTPCTADAACDGGLCSALLDAVTKLPISPGVCMDRCGDGQCTGLETCGFSNVLTRCNEDCGFQCGIGSLCLTGADCGSGICNLAQCHPGGLPNLSGCTSNSACTSGVCNFGICMSGGLADSFPCTTHAACASGLCSAGLCTQGGHANGSLCTANAACASGICSIGFCTAPNSVPALVPCTNDDACRSGDCFAGVCAQICGDGYCDGAELCGSEDQLLQCTTDCSTCSNGTLCTSNATCTSGVCNFGTCHAGNLGFGKLCSTSAACRSGSCVAGVCASQCGDGICEGPETCGKDDVGLSCKSDCNRCGNGTPCLSNATCSSNTCNFGFCISYRSVGNFGLCTTDNACGSLDCRAGVCWP